jgi:autophagy-related protein 18
MFHSISWNFDSVEIDDGARGIVEMLFCTSLIALVGAADQPSSSPRKLQIVNTKVRSRPRVR